jgi:hypothetical protein
VSNTAAHCCWQRVVAQSKTLLGVVVRSTITIWSRCRSFTRVQLPIAISLEPSGVMSSLSVFRVPFRGPLNARAKSVLSAPVVGSRAASAVRATPLTVAKVPPMYSRPPLTAMS